MIHTQENMYTLKTDMFIYHCYTINKAKHQVKRVSCV